MRAYFGEIGRITTSMKIHCPRCHAEIPVADIQPAADLAICRPCNRMWKLTELTADGDDGNIDLYTPPKSVLIRAEMDGIHIIYRKVEWVTVWFLGPFTATWSGVSLTGIYIVPIMRGELTLFGALFGIPFLGFSVLLVSMLLYALFGRQEMRITASGTDSGCGEIIYFSGIGRIGRRQRIPYDRETRITVHTTPEVGDSIAKQEIQIYTSNEKSTVFEGDLNKPCHYIAAVLRNAIFPTP